MAHMRAMRSWLPPASWVHCLLLLLLLPGCNLLDLPPSPERPLPDLSTAPTLTYPGVKNLAIGPLSGGTFIFVLSFTTPMDEKSTLTALSLRKATEPVVRGEEGMPIPLTASSFQWNAERTELLFTASLPDPTPVVLVLTPKARGKNGLPLDGTQGSTPDPHSYQRSEDDGFSGPSTYISLPFYPQGSAALPSHPSYLLSQNLPLLACYPQGNTASSPVTGGDLGRFPTPNPGIPCTLEDRRLLPDHPGSYERLAPRAWNPADLPRAEFLRDGVTIPARTGLGWGTPLFQSTVTIMTLENDTTIRGQEFFPSSSTAPARFYLAPWQAPEPLLPIAGFSENLIFFSAVRYTFTRVFSQPGEKKLSIPEATLLANELKGDRLRVTFDPSYQGVIVGNSATEILADTPTPCGFSCTIEIELVISSHVAVQDKARIVSPDLTFLPESPLTSGTWTLRVTGGTDLMGLPRTDGIRNGDERTGIPNNDQYFTLVIP